MPRYHTLRLILGDQLNARHSWYREKSSGVLYLLAELRQETDYVQHHIQKVCGFFLAMEKFAAALQKAGHRVKHLTLDDTLDYASLAELLQDYCDRYGVKTLQYQQPDEFRVAQQLRELSIGGVEKTCVDSEHFYLPFSEIGDYFTRGEALKMEFFYRKMRKRFSVLMEKEKPCGGQWNFDAENRQSLKKQDLQQIPKPVMFKDDVSEIMKRLKAHKVKTFGEPSQPFFWPTDRQQARCLLRHFCQHCLPLFGRFQDAMTANSEHQWSLYHSRLSFALNSKMLSPHEVIQAAIKTWQAQPNINLAQIEGFVRQILGWREYMRGIYWANMPDYAAQNALKTERALPGYFWNAETKMNCVAHCVKQSLSYAYAHHIQRLMITGNFCLLAGIDVRQVDQWYLGIYIDALEWVEMPNTLGMSLYADGGLIATKPYAASGNYINKMSDYCKTCDYAIKEKTSQQACPFNSLYWSFMQRHRDRFAGNPRNAMVYRNWDKQTEAQQKAVLRRADWCLDNLDRL